LLNEAGGFAGTYGKTLPVDDGVGTVGDVQRAAGLIELHAAMDDGRCSRVGLRGGGEAEQQGIAERFQAAGMLVGTACGFAHRGHFYYPCNQNVPFRRRLTVLSPADWSPVSLSAKPQSKSRFQLLRKARRAPMPAPAKLA